MGARQFLCISILNVIYIRNTTKDCFGNKDKYNPKTNFDFDGSKPDKIHTSSIQNILVVHK